MDFSIGLLKHYLNSEGFRIVAEPRNLDRTFRVASAPDDLPLSGHTLAVYSASAHVLSLDYAIPVLVVCPPGANVDAAARICPEPLVVISEKTPAWFAESINLYLSAITSWTERMEAIIDSGGDATKLLQSSEPVLGHFLGLTDALYRHVATTPHIAPIDQFSKVLVETGQYPPEKIGDIEQLASQEKWSEQFRTLVSQGGNSINTRPNASRLYRLNGHYAAHLVMVSDKRIDEGEVLLFDLLADKVGTLLDKDWKEHDPYARPYTRFLEQAFSVPVHDRAHFLAQAEHFEIPTTGVFEVCVIAGAQNHGGLNHLTRQINLALPNSWALILDDRIYILLHAPAQKSGQLASAERQLFEFARHLESGIGVSNRIDDPEFLHLGRLEADIALEYGRKNSSKYDAVGEGDPNLHVAFRFKRYLPYYLVDPQADTGGFLAQFEKAPHPINKMRRDDRANGTRDFTLLRIYLYYDSNAKKTAEIMHMHRNTVDYRLKKIRDVYHIDLSDNDTRLFLHYLFGVLD